MVGFSVGIDVRELSHDCFDTNSTVYIGAHEKW
jgi:hypothetical protein